MEIHKSWTRVKPYCSLRSISRQKVIPCTGREILKVTVLPFFILCKCTQGRSYFSRVQSFPVIDRWWEEAVSRETAERGVQHWIRCSGIVEVSNASPVPEQPPNPSIDVAALLPLFVSVQKWGVGWKGRVSKLPKVDLYFNQYL